MHPIYTILKDRLKKLKGYFIKKKQVNLVYLFGSILTPYFRKNSDIDIAVLFDKKIHPRKYFSLKLQMTGELIDILKFNDVTLIVLNEDNLLLNFEIISNGRLIFSRSEKERVDFISKTISKYLDFEPVQRIHFAKI